MDPTKKYTKHKSKSRLVFYYESYIILLLTAK